MAKLNKNSLIILIAVSLLFAGCGSSVPSGTAAPGTSWQAADSSSAASSSSEEPTPTPSPAPTAAPKPTKTPTPSPTPEVIHAPEPDNAQLNLMSAWLNALAEEQMYRTGSADYTVGGISKTQLGTASLVTMTKEYYNYSEKIHDTRIKDYQDDSLTGKVSSEKDTLVILDELFGADREQADALLQEFPVVDNCCFVNLDGFHEEAPAFFFEINEHSIKDDKVLTVSGRMYYTDYRLFADRTAHDITSFEAIFSLGDAKAPMPYRFEKVTLEQSLADVLPNLVSGQGTYFTTQELKFRTVPSYQGDYNGTVPADTPVNVLDFGSAGFYHISFEGKDGYLPGSCLLPGEFAAGPQPSNTVTIMCDTGLFDWPGMGADEILLALPKGTPVFYYCDAENGTFFAECNGIKGFVPAATLNEFEPWQEAYYNFLGSNFSSSTTFILAYIDGDEIPELLVGYGNTLGTDTVNIYHYYQGTVSYLGSIGTYGELIYLGYGNMIKDFRRTGKTSGVYSFYSIVGDSLVTQLVLTVQGGTFIYQEDSNGSLRQLSWEEYETIMATVFPTNMVRVTPDTHSGDGARFCNQEGLQMILYNPALASVWDTKSHIIIYGD